MENQKIPGLNGTTVFIEMVREQLRNNVPGFEVEIREEAPDNFGIHWRGFRAVIQSGNIQMYIHTGLVYHPDTRAGIYTEIDRGNNLEIFEKAWEGVRPSEEYDLSRDEADYLKFFYPSRRWDELMETETAEGQADLWRQYFESVLKGLADALNAPKERQTAPGQQEPDRIKIQKNSRNGGKTFSFTVTDLNTMYWLTKIFTDALREAQLPGGGTEIHNRAADRYGIYSAGVRLFAHRGNTGKNFYLWCGLLFTDEKKSGLIIEADRYSNQDTFDMLQENIKGSDRYEIERSEGFIKLFLPEETYKAAYKIIKEKAAEEGRRKVRRLLDPFIKDCLAAFLGVPDDKADYKGTGIRTEAPAKEFTSAEVVYETARAVAGAVKIKYAELVATFSQLPEHESELSVPQDWMKTARDELKRAAGCQSTKAILSVNPSGVKAADRYTLYLECEGNPDMEKVGAAVNGVLKKGTAWEQKIPPVYDGQKITVQYVGGCMQ